MYDTYNSINQYMRVQYSVIQTWNKKHFVYPLQHDSPQ